jgi:hypothetical protein
MGPGATLDACCRRLAQPDHDDGFARGWPGRQLLAGATSEGLDLAGNAREWTEPHRRPRRGQGRRLRNAIDDLIAADVH